MSSFATRPPCPICVMYVSLITFSVCGKGPCQHEVFKATYGSSSTTVIFCLRQNRRNRSTVVPCFKTTMISGLGASPRPDMDEFSLMISCTRHDCTLARTSATSFNSTSKLLVSGKTPHCTGNAFLTTIYFRQPSCFTQHQYCLADSQLVKCCVVAWRILQ